MNEQVAIWGWDLANTEWVKVLVDDDGHLKVDVVSGAALESRVYGLDTTWQAVASELTDATFAEAVRGLVTASALYGFDTTTWRRILLFQSDADAQVTTAYSQRVQSYLYGYNGATWDRLLVDASKFLKVNIAAVDATLTTVDSFGGNVYSKTMTMADDNPTRFEAAAKKLRDVVIIVKTHPMLLGETGVVVYPVGVGETVGFTKVDISTLYFQNANAGDDGLITILGVEE